MLPCAAYGVAHDAVELRRQPRETWRTGVDLIGPIRIGRERPAEIREVHRARILGRQFRKHRVERIDEKLADGIQQRAGAATELLGEPRDPS